MLSHRLFVRRLGDSLALIEPQRPERQPGMPEVNPVHGDRSLGQAPGGAVNRPQHLGGAGGGQEQRAAVRVPAGALTISGRVGQKGLPF